LKVKSGSDLVAIVALSALLIIIIAFLPSNDLRIVLGLPFLLVFPGYTLVAALFPGKTDLGGVERAALSLGLSIAVVPLTGLILNYTPWGIALNPILASVTVFIAVTSIAAWYRRGRLPGEERFAMNFNIGLSQWTVLSGWDRALTALLAVSIVGAIGIISYVVITPTTGEKYTEFYVLGLDGKAEGYPSELKVGDEGRVRLGVVNHEYEDDLTYRVEILVDSNNSGMYALTLNHEEKWEQEVGFIPEEAGGNQKVEFVLYRIDEEDPYRTLHLWVDVSNSS
jgi:uncharacterized membrane protein